MANGVVRRDPQGRIMKGSTLNPHGAQRTAVGDSERYLMGEILRVNTPAAMRKLAALLDATQSTVNPITGEIHELPDRPLQFKAALALLDRGIGKVGDVGMQEHHKADGTAFDMSRLTDAELQAANILRSGMERVAREDEEGIRPVRRPIPVLQPNGDEAMIVSDSDRAHEDDPSNEKDGQEGNLTDEDDL